jgi:DNA-binding NarL/FixJ family response regulator
MFFLNLSETDFEKIIDFVIQLKKNKINQKKDLEVLTAKEKEVFELVANGFTTKKIAEKLFVESSTISTHRKKIKQKLKFKSNYDWYNFYNQVRV